MQKRWFAFFVRDPENAVSLRRLMALNFGLVLGLVPGLIAFEAAVCSHAFCEEPILPGMPAVVASSSPMNPEFLTAPSFELEPEPSVAAKVQVGDSLRLTVQGFQGGGVGDIKVESSVPVDKLREEGFELLSVPAPVGSPFPAASPKPLSVSVVIVKAGKLTLPALGFRDTSGKWVGRTNPFPVEVASAIKSDDPSPEKPAEGLPPVSLGFPWKLIVAFGALALALIALGIYAGIRWSRRNRKGVASKKADGPPKPEDEVALAELDRLEREGFLKLGRFKPHYFRVSDVLKAYFGKRFTFDALECTSGEILIELELKKAASEELLRELRNFFYELDEVKFTDRLPLPDVAEKLVGRAREFILKTKRLPPITSTAPVVAGRKP